MKRENTAGKVIILFIVGLFPMIFAVLYNCFFDNEDYEVIVISVCTFMGGLLDIFVLHREYGISISEKNKINIKLLILVLLFAIFYSTTTDCILNKNTYINLYGGNDSLLITDWIGIGILGPVGEELIYRYSIFSTIISGRKKYSLILSVFVSSILFMIMHLQGGILRNVDLFLFGCVASLIFFVTNNIIYSIFFHSVSNFTVYGLALIYQKYEFDSRILLISVPVLVIITLMMILYIVYQHKNVETCKRNWM